MFDPQPTDELPPPSYEVSQEAFDQKTRQGIQASLDPQANANEDIWEEWDETKFEANARALPEDSASSSSSAPALPPTTAQKYPKEKAPSPHSPPPPQQEEPAVRPLRIVKKTQTAAAYNKAVEARSYQPNPHPGAPASSSDEGTSLARNFSILSVGQSTPPPMFEPIGPSLDGPDYDEVTMSYVPGDSRPSSPMSILSTDSYRPPVLPPPRPNMVMPPPPPPPVQHQTAQRPISTQTQRPQYQQQQPRRRVGFDPMSAYKYKSPFTPGLEPTPERVDPSSFYNSAVSAVLSTASPQRSAITQTYRTNGVYQRELQHPQPHHAVAFDSFAAMGNMGDVNMGRERAMSVISTDSSYYPNSPVNMPPNRGWDHRAQPFHPGR